MASNCNIKKPRIFSAFCLPSEAGKPEHLKESGITLTKGKIIRMARGLKEVIGS
jgi:hypothetical protein